jgi:hypothetical protein
MVFLSLTVGWPYDGQYVMVFAFELVAIEQQMLVESVKSDAFQFASWSPFDNEIIPNLRHYRHSERMMAGIPYLIVVWEPVFAKQK